LLANDDVQTLQVLMKQRLSLRLQLAMINKLYNDYCTVFAVQLYGLAFMKSHAKEAQIKNDDIMTVYLYKYTCESKNVYSLIDVHGKYKFHQTVNPSKFK
jgi:hypothetical protein